MMRPALVGRQQGGVAPDQDVVRLHVPVRKRGLHLVHGAHAAADLHTRMPIWLDRKVDGRHIILSGLRYFLVGSSAW